MDEPNEKSHILITLNAIYKTKYKTNFMLKQVLQSECTVINSKEEKMLHIYCQIIIYYLFTSMLIKIIIF